MKRLALALGLAVGLLATSSSAALAAGNLSGTYKTTITGAGAGPMMVFDGTWTTTFTTGKYVWKNNGKLEDTGKYNISGSTITFTSNAPSGFFGCRTTGKYRFKLTGNMLKFTVISDAQNCHGRAVVLTNQVFTKV